MFGDREYAMMCQEPLPAACRLVHACKTFRCLLSAAVWQCLRVRVCMRLGACAAHMNTYCPAVEATSVAAAGLKHAECVAWPYCTATSCVLTGRCRCVFAAVCAVQHGRRVWRWCGILTGQRRAQPAAERLHHRRSIRRLQRPVLPGGQHGSAAQQQCCCSSPASDAREHARIQRPLCWQPLRAAPAARLCSSVLQALLSKLRTHHQEPCAPDISMRCSRANSC